MSLTIRPTKDGKHETLSRTDKGFTLKCRNEHRSVSFEKVMGGIDYCPLCGEKFGEWGKTVRL